MYSLASDWYLTSRVTPFGNLRIKGCWLLPEAFRSLPRPSSPDGSKTSTVNPFSLDHITLYPFPITVKELIIFGGMGIRTPDP
jgi:hypothetical protein